MVSDVPARLQARSAFSGISLPGPLAAKLVAYYELLQRWNRKINLTSLSDSDEAIDRLLLEPVAAAAVLSSDSRRLIDLGSGGGSPAIPLALALSPSLLVMVESRSRKAAFLREAVRELGLPGVVENARFEEVALRPEYRQAMDLVSIRAVKTDGSTLDAALAFLAPGGRIALFESLSASPPSSAAEVTTSATVPLLRDSRLRVLQHRPHPR